MKIELSKEQLNQILEYDRTRSLTTASNIALSLVDNVLSNYAKEIEN